MSAKILADIIVVGNLVQLTLVLALETWAYSKTKHRSLLYLIASTLAALTALALLSLPRTMGVNAITPTQYRIGVGVYVFHIVVGLWGTFALLTTFISLTSADRGVPRAFAR